MTNTPPIYAYHEGKLFLRKGDTESDPIDEVAVLWNCETGTWIRLGNREAAFEAANTLVLRRQAGSGLRISVLEASAETARLLNRLCMSPVGSATDLLKEIAVIWPTLH